MPGRVGGPTPAGAALLQLAPAARGPRRPGGRGPPAAAAAAAAGRPWPGGCPPPAPPPSPVRRAAGTVTGHAHLRPLQRFDGTGRPSGDGQGDPTGPGDEPHALGRRRRAASSSGGAGTTGRASVGEGEAGGEGDQDGVVGPAPGQDVGHLGLDVLTGDVAVSRPDPARDSSTAPETSPTTATLLPEPAPPGRRRTVTVPPQHRFPETCPGRRVRRRARAARAFRGGTGSRYTPERALGRARVRTSPAPTSSDRHHQGPASLTQHATAPPATGPAPGPPARGRSARLLAWVAVALASLAAWVAPTWPLAIQMDRIWTVSALFTWPGTLPSAATTCRTRSSSRWWSTTFVSCATRTWTCREGAAGPVPLKTPPWMCPGRPGGPALAPAGSRPPTTPPWSLSSVATGLAAFAWLRRHTRWQLLAAAGALAYACAPHRMFQLTGHFNAVMWWAFPPALGRSSHGGVPPERASAGAWPAPGRGRGGGGRGRRRRVPPHPLSHRPARLPGSSGPWGPPWPGAAPCPGPRPRRSRASWSSVWCTCWPPSPMCSVGDVQGSNGGFEPVPEVRARFGPMAGGPGPGGVRRAVGLRRLGGRRRGGHRPGRRSGRPCCLGAWPHAVLLVPLLLLTLGPAVDVGPVPPLPVLLRPLLAVPVTAAGAPAAHGAHQPGPGPAGRVRARPGRSTAAGRPAPGGWAGPRPPWWWPVPSSCCRTT